MDCTVCKKPDAIHVKERVAGSKGKTRNSFASEYQLCRGCIAMCSSVGAIESMKKDRRKGEVAIVLAKTYAWLQTKHRMGYTHSS
jgi:hypothetical protein